MSHHKQTPAHRLWRVNREAVLLLTGPRALLMQIAHPAIAAGVREHSGWQTQPVRRLLRTLWLINQAALGDEDSARRAVQKIEHRHRYVKGHYRLRPAEKPLAYHADDSALKMWVLATLIDGSIYGYQRWVGALSEDALREYYAGWQLVARRFSIAREHIPADYPCFQNYVSHMLHSETLQVGADAKALAAALLGATRLFKNATRSFVASTLPDSLRRAYDLHGEADDGRWQKNDRRIRWLLRITPPPFRYSPLAMLARLK